MMSSVTCPYCITAFIKSHIPGASKPEQVLENLTALEVAKQLTPEVLAEIEAAAATTPKALYDWGRGTARIF